MLINETHLKAQLPVAKAFTFDLLKPDLRRAEIRYIKPALGTTLYNALVTAYGTDGADYDSMSADDKALMDYIFPCLAQLGVSLYLPKGNVTITDNGVMATHSETMKPAFEWQVKQVIREYMFGGYDALEDMLLYLEENAATYTDWDSSEARELMVQNADQYQEYVNIGNKRRIYNLLKPVIRRVQRNVASVASEDLYDELVTQMKADTLTANNMKLIRDVRGYVAHQTYAEALDELGVIVDDEGVHLLNTAFASTVNARTPAETERLENIKLRHESIAKGYLKDLDDYLQTNADDYPLFKASDQYITDDSRGFQNDENWGTYHVG